MRYGIIFRWRNEVNVTFFNPNGYSESELRDYLICLDAEVLRLYDLPASAERLLLDQFTGEQRPGVPFSFASYYRR